MKTTRSFKMQTKTNQNQRYFRKTRLSQTIKTNEL